MEVQVYEYNGNRYMKVKDVLNGVDNLLKEGQTQISLSSFKNWCIKALTIEKE